MKLRYHPSVSKSHLATVILYVRDLFEEGAQMLQNSKLWTVEDILENLHSDIELLNKNELEGKIKFCYI